MKTAGVKDWLKSHQLGAIPRAYEGTVGQVPLAEAGLLGGAGALGAYHASGMLLRPMARRMAAAMGHTDPQAVDASVKKLQRYMAGLGGAAGVGYTALKHMDTGSGVPGALKSLVQGPKYWKANPGARHRLLQKRKQDILGAQHKFDPKKDLFTSDRQKTSNYQDPFTSRVIPVDISMHIIQSDPYLSLDEKTTVNTLLSKADEEDTGAASGASITGAALRAGIGFLPAYGLGRVATTALGMGAKKSKAISLLGGLASGLYNSGMFEGE